MSHSASAACRLHPENGVNLFAAALCSASLGRRRLLRHRLAKRDADVVRSDRQDAKLGSVPTTHCADLLTARENLRCCNVRSCQKKCDKALYYLTTDRGAPCALYPAIVRSAVGASPILRYASLNCEVPKPGEAPRQQFACRLIAAAMLSLWRPHVCHVDQIGRGQDAGAAEAVSVVCRSNEGARQTGLGSSVNVWCCGQRTRERTWQYQRE
jgi:hypothetical protein